MPRTSSSDACRSVCYFLVLLLAAGMVPIGSTYGQVTLTDPKYSSILDLEAFILGQFSLGLMERTLADGTRVACPILERQEEGGATSIALKVNNRASREVFNTRPLRTGRPGVVNGRVDSPPAVVAPNAIQTVYLTDQSRLGVPIRITQRTEILESNQLGYPLPDTLRIEITLRNESDTAVNTDLRLMLDGKLPARPVASFDEFLERAGSFAFERSLSTDTPVFTTDLADPAAGIIYETTMDVHLDEFRLFMVDNLAKPTLAVRFDVDRSTLGPTNILLVGYGMLDAHELTMAPYDLATANQFDYKMAIENPLVRPLEIARTNALTGQPGDSGIVVYWRGIELAPRAEEKVAVFLRPLLSGNDLPMLAAEAFEYFRDHGALVDPAVQIPTVAGSIDITKPLYILDRPLRFAPGTELRFLPGTALFLYSDRVTVFDGVTFTSPLPLPPEDEEDREEGVVYADPGAWGGIYVSSGSVARPPLDSRIVFRNCTIRYAGGLDVRLFKVYDLLQIDSDAYPEGRGPVPLVTNTFRPFSGHAALTLLNAHVFVDRCRLEDFAGSAVLATIDCEPIVRNSSVATIADPTSAIPGITYMTRPQSHFLPGLDFDEEWCLRSIFPHYYTEDVVPLRLGRSLSWTNVDLPYVPEGDIEVPLNLTLTIDPPDGAQSPVRIEVPELVDFARANQYQDRTEIAVFGALRVDPDFAFEPTQLVDDENQVVPHSFDQSGGTLQCPAPPLPSPSGNRAVVFTALSGTPCGGAFEATVLVARNAGRRIASYGIDVTWPAGIRLVEARDGAFGAVPDVLVRTDASGNEVGAVVSARRPGAILRNGALFTLSLVNADDVTGSIVLSHVEQHLEPSVVFAARDNPYPNPQAEPLMPVIPGPPAPEFPPEILAEPPLLPTPPPETRFAAKALEVGVLTGLLGEANAAGPLPVTGVPGNWGGVWLYPTADDEFCRIENARITDGVVGIYAGGASPRIAGCRVERTSDYGIFCDAGANPQIVDTLVAESGMYGIAVDDNASPTIQGCIVRDNEEAGILVAKRAMPIVAETVVFHNKYGIDIYEFGAPNLGNVENQRENDDGRNRFTGNRPGDQPNSLDIRNQTPNDIMAQNNFWGFFDPDPEKLRKAIDARIIDRLDNAAFGRVIYLSTDENGQPSLGREATPRPTHSATPTPTMTPGFPPFVIPSPTPAAGEGIPIDHPGGLLTRDLTLSGFVRLLDTLRVVGNGTLTILAGAVIDVSPETAQGARVEIRVESGAALRVLGSRQQPVVLTATHPTKRWGGLVIDGRPLASEGHKVEYARISGAEIGLSIWGASPFVNHCQFQDNQHAIRMEPTGTGIRREEASPRIRNCIFTRQMDGASLLLINGATPNLGNVAAKDPGLNSFVLNNTNPIAVDIAALGYFPLADKSIKAEGNYFTVRRYDGRIERVEDLALLSTPSPDPLENRDRLNREAGRLLDLDPLGKSLGSDSIFPIWQQVDRTVVSRDAYVISDSRVFQGEIDLDLPLLITNTGRLRILAGTRIRVRHGREIFIACLGVLRAEGTAANPVRFESYSRLPYESRVAGARQPRKGDWVGVHFYEHVGEQETLLRFCEVLDAQKAIGCFRSSPLIERSVIRNFSDYGIYCSGEIVLIPPQPGLTPTPIPRAQTADVDPFGLPAPKVNLCIIEGGQYGLYCEEGAPVVRSTVLTGAMVAGFYADGRSGVPDFGTVDLVRKLSGGGNWIAQNQMANGINRSRLLIAAQGNYWGTTDPARIDEWIFDDEEIDRSLPGTARGRVDFSPPLFEAPASLVAEMGDLDGDGAITLADLTAFIARWHTGIGDQTYTARADFDGDLKVDHRDLASLVSRLGQE